MNKLITPAQSPYTLNLANDVLNPTIGKNRLPELYEIMSRLS